MRSLRFAALALSLASLLACSSSGSTADTAPSPAKGGASAAAGGASSAGASAATGGTTAATGGAPTTTGPGGSGPATGGAVGTGASGGGPGGGSAGTASGGTSAGGSGPPAGGTYSSAVSIVVEPGDGGSALLAAIAAAKTSIHVTMYLFSSSPMQQALLNAHKAGIEVKVILQKTFPTGGASNQQAYALLTKMGIQVAWASTAFTLTHEKCVIIDASSAWIMTMNLTNSSPMDNREYLALDTDADDVAEAEAIFATMPVARAIVLCTDESQGCSRSCGSPRQKA